MELLDEHDPRRAACLDGSAIAGVTGAILAVPVVAIVLTVLRELTRDRRAGDPESAATESA